MCPSLTFLRVGRAAAGATRRALQEAERRTGGFVFVWRRHEARSADLERIYEGLAGDLWCSSSSRFEDSSICPGHLKTCTAKRRAASLEVQKAAGSRPVSARPSGGSERVLENVNVVCEMILKCSSTSVCLKQLKAFLRFDFVVVSGLKKFPLR